MKQKLYIDKYGQQWLRISADYVRRLKNPTIGGWFDGQGLTFTGLSSK